MVLNMNSFNRHYKNKCRLLAIENGMGLGAPSKRAVVLPGPEKLDVALALQMELIDVNTHIYAIEKHKRLRLGINQYLGERFHTYELNRAFEGASYRDVDYAFLDFCGEVTQPLLNELQIFFEEGCVNGARVSLTFSSVGRNNPFYGQYYDYKPRPAMKKIQVGFRQNEFLVGTFQNAGLITCNERKTVHALAEVLPTGSTVEWVYKYRDNKVPMLLINTVIRN